MLTVFHVVRGQRNPMIPTHAAKDIRQRKAPCPSLAAEMADNEMFATLEMIIKGDLVSYLVSEVFFKG